MNVYAVDYHNRVIITVKKRRAKQENFCYHQSTFKSLEAAKKALERRLKFDIEVALEEVEHRKRRLQIFLSEYQVEELSR